MKNKVLTYLLALMLVSSSMYGISNSDATKFVDQYESMSQKFIGFFNCVAKVMTGDEILVVENMKQPVYKATDIQGCFNMVGLKTGPGMTKFLAIFSSSKKENDVVVNEGTVELSNEGALKAAREEARREVEQAMNKTTRAPVEERTTASEEKKAAKPRVEKREPERAASNTSPRDAVAKPKW